MSRYSRQERFAPLGGEGQARLRSATALVCGCGALGSVIAERLARAGVGRLRLVDRDWVELSNLQRQALFTEEDAAEARPKSVAAAEALGRINGEVQVEALVEDVTYENIAQLAEGCDLLLDGTDNFETRYLINDYCVQRRIPWVHGGCLGAGGQAMTILPCETACFRCLMPEPPSPGSFETCDSAGVLGPAVGLVACWQASEALKILSGNRQAVCRGLWVLDAWAADCRVIGLAPQRDCPACQQRQFPFLDGSVRTESTVLCGKNAVQIVIPGLDQRSLADVADRWVGMGELRRNPYFVRLTTGQHHLTLFRGGRIVVEGTTDVAEARGIIARAIGA